MSTVGIVTGHIGLTVTVDIGILGIGTTMSAPAVGVLDGLVWVPVSTVSEHSPVTTMSIVTGHLDFVVTVQVGESSPGTLMGAPSVDVGGVDGSGE